MPYVLAVDGGNTKTIALVATTEGEVLGAAYGGCGDIYNAAAGNGALDPAMSALKNVEGTILAALAAAQVEADDLAVSVLNMAGADWPEDIEFWREAMTVRGYGRSVHVQNDALGALYIGSPDATGVSIVCGTGVATGARASDGRVWHTSYWQDEAQSNAHLGQKTLVAVFRSALGLEEPTALTARLLNHFGAPSVEELLYLFHNRRHPAPGGLDRLAPILLDEAEAGDGVALRVVREHGKTLGDVALVAARRVEIEHTPFHLVLAGGVFRHPTKTLQEAIVARVRLAAPDVHPVRTTQEPITGVLIQALTLAGTVIDSATRDRLMKLALPG
ncbi:MAG TPA: BadF/BadG/BcrA/BcrD ATPase family protein [Ktedonobacterales bacterium]|jgi:N-acetylglucosamine kinase-like BadF-type ATPase|nr:BadF/BadG/BcrA/BcrD ATPase family protein [Ktedonobacterales bacterium]